MTLPLTRTPAPPDESVPAMVKTDGIVPRWLLEEDMTVSERFGKLGRSNFEKKCKQVARTSRTPPFCQSGIPNAGVFQFN